jgi:metal-responsive CopG/Arc/MetJ family transcriptional regulator
MERIHLHLTPQQLKDLEKLSKKTGLSRADLLRRAWDDYVKRFKK